MADYGEYLTVPNIIALIIGIVGLVWLIYGIWKNWKINQIASWPKTDARVLNALAEPANESAGTRYLDPQELLPKTNSDAMYKPLVVYVYSVDGQQYQSTNLAYGGADSYNALDTKTIMAQIVPGSSISVFYNPDSPSESYIYNGVSNYLGVIGGIILLIISGYIFYYHNTVQHNRNFKDLVPGQSEKTPSLSDMEKKSARTTTRNTNALPYNITATQNANTRARNATQIQTYRRGLF